MWTTYCVLYKVIKKRRNKNYSDVFDQLFSMYFDSLCSVADIVVAVMKSSTCA